MGWILVAGFVVWLLSRCGKKQVDATKDDFSGNTVGSLFLLDNLIDHPPNRDEDRDNEDHASEDDRHQEEWFDDDNM